MTTEVQGVGAAVEAEPVDDLRARPTAGRLAVEDEDLRTVALGEGRGGESGEAGADDDHVAAHRQFGGGDRFHANSTIEGRPL